MDAETIKFFVLASHGNLEKVKTMLAEQPELLNVKHQWGEDDFEDGLGAAAHVGNAPIAEFLLEQGAPLTVCAAAALGRYDDVKTFLDADSSAANARGAHGIPIMFHAAMSGNVQLTELLKTRGCTEGYNHAVHGAIAHGETPMVEWLLNNGVTDITVQNYEGKTPLEKAQEYEDAEVIALLENYRASS